MIVPYFVVIWIQPDYALTVHPDPTSRILNSEIRTGGSDNRVFDNHDAGYGINLFLFQSR